MKPYLVGLAGPAGVGKDTTANILEEPRYHYAFARPLKAMLSAIELYEPRRADKEKLIPGLGFSYRQAAQTLGTEWGRALHPELWLELAKREWEKRGDGETRWAKKGDTFMVLTDVRFENEAQWIRENGTVVHIYGRQTTIEGQAAAHASETGLAVWPEDYRLDNSGTHEDLRIACRDMGIKLREKREELIRGQAT